jgi:RNA polymerase sigma factor (sigma-70 family)
VENIINVVIVEDSEMVRDAISMIIKGWHGFQLKGVFVNAEEALIHIPIINPDVVLMDLGLPGISGIDCIRKLHIICPKIQFLVCTISEEDEYIIEAIKAGATGYILKNTSPSELLEAIRDIYKGGSPMSSIIARKIVQTIQNIKVNKEMESLTAREKEILQLLSKGFRYKEIGDQMHIDLGTVKRHIHNIYEKLHVQSRTDALNKAFPR